MRTYITGSDNAFHRTQRKRRLRALRFQLEELEKQLRDEGELDPAARLSAVLSDRGW